MKKQKSKFDAIVAGHLCLDITPKFRSELLGKQIEEILSPGKLVNVEEAVVSTGGPVSNAGLALKKFGIKTSFITKVGGDAFGKCIIDILSKSIDTSGIKIEKNESSSYTVVIAPPGIDRIFLHDPGTNNTFNSGDIDYEIVKEAKLFHLGYPPLMRCLYLNEGEDLVKIFKKVKSYGVVTSLDVSLPDPSSESGRVDWQKILKKCLLYVDIFLPSFEELLFMADRTKYMSLRESAGKGDMIDRVTPGDLGCLSKWCLECGVKILVIKCGHRGIYVRTVSKELLKSIGNRISFDIDNWSDRELWMPCYKVESIASATGSGDSAIAGFLSAFLRDKDIEFTLRCSNTAGAQNLRGYDAISGLGDWQEVEDMANDRNRKLNMFSIGDKNWIFDNNLGMFEKK